MTYLRALWRSRNLPEVRCAVGGHTPVHAEKPRCNDYFGYLGRGLIESTSTNTRCDCGFKTAVVNAEDQTFAERMAQAWTKEFSRETGELVREGVLADVC